VVTQQIDKDNTVTMLSISPTRRIVASTSSDRIVRLWDMDTAEEIEQLNHEGHVRQLICSDDGNLVDLSHFLLEGVVPGDPNTRFGCGM
jgi:WD40 repeat protein